MQGKRQTWAQMSFFLPQRGCLARGFASLDMVDLEHVFEVRALVGKSVPKFMSGAFRGGFIRRQRLEERLATFNAGKWVQLSETSLDVAMLGAEANSRKRRRGGNNDAENRAARALQLTQMGELSSARQALEASLATREVWTPTLPQQCHLCQRIWTLTCSTTN